MASVSIEAKGKRVFQELIEGFKRQVPAKHREFDREAREWRINRHGLTWLELWLGEVRYQRDDVEILRDGQRGAESSTSLALEDAYAALHLRTSADRGIVEVVYKHLAQRLHPDKQEGDEEQMKRVNAARDVIMRQLQSGVAA
jgi:hypothetical protein